jgi:4'-phosphopantetheinyl transferase
VLRELLGRYLDVSPGEVAFRLERRGKPSVAVPVGAAQRLSFNVSHSGPLALYAFSGQAAVGIDVQRARTRRGDESAVAARAFGAPVSARLRQLNQAERQREFLRLWTRHEARLKCIGAGLMGFHRYEENAGVPLARVWLAELDLGTEGAAAAVAVRDHPPDVRCWAWRADPRPVASRGS